MFIFWGASVSASTLKEKLSEAQPGDFVVLSHRNQFSLLLVTHVDKEEVWVEERSTFTTPSSWREWIAHPEPLPTEWIGCRINLTSSLLNDCYSFTDHSWVHPEEQGSLFSLLDIPLQEIEAKERRRMGAKPSEAFLEQRAIWNPPQIIDGAPLSHPFLSAMKSTLRLSSDEELEIESYFDQSSFPFPYWIEWKQIRPIRIRAVDSGRGAAFEKREIPKHPLIWRAAQKKEGFWDLSFDVKSAFSTFHLFAVHLSSARQTIPIPYIRTELKSIQVAQSTLESLLLPGEQYQWFLIPDADAELAAESPPFRWEISR